MKIDIMWGQITSTREIILRDRYVAHVRRRSYLNIS